MQSGKASPDFGFARHSNSGDPFVTWIAIRITKRLRIRPSLLRLTIRPSKPPRFPILSILPEGVVAQSSSFLI